MRHQAFLELIASEAHGTLRQQEVYAGLLVLTFVELYQAQRHGAPVSSERARQAARSAIANLDQQCSLTKSMQAVCERLSDTDSEEGSLAVLTDFGREFEFRAEWALVLDINDTTIATVWPDEDYRVLHDALLRRGSALRELGDLEMSHNTYCAAEDEARARGDKWGRLRTRIGFAKNAFARGNIPEAEAILRRVVARSSAALPYAPLLSMAMHELAVIAFHRGDFTSAVRLLLDAYPSASAGWNRESILVDLGNVMAVTNEFAAAAEIYSVTAASSSCRTLKWIVRINLLDIAAQQRQEAKFESIRSSLRDAAFPPALRAEYEFHLGKGYAALGKPENARSWFEKALASAAASGAHRVVFATEAALKELNAKVDGSTIAADSDAMLWREMVLDVRRLSTAAIGVVQ